MIHSDSRRRGTRARDTKISVDCTRIDAELNFNSLDGTVASGPLELVAMRDYYVSRHRMIALDTLGKDIAIQVPEVPPVRSDRRLDLSPRRTPRSWTNTYRVEQGGPAVHYLMRCELFGDVHFSWVIVARPERGYGFLAAYCCRVPPMAPRPGTVDCYQLRCVPYRSIDTLDEDVNAAVRQEMDDLFSLKRGPHKPHIGDLRPLERSSVAVVAGGAGRLITDRDSGKLTLELDATKARQLSPADCDALRTLVKVVDRTVPKRLGRKPDYDAGAVRDAFMRLQTACTGLLASLPARKWPSVRNEGSAKLLVEEHLPFDHLDVRQAAQDLLVTGRRRPRARDLAIRILSRVTGHSQRHLAELIRKK